MNNWNSAIAQAHSGDVLVPITTNCASFVQKIFSNATQRNLDSIRKQQDFVAFAAGNVSVSAVDVVDLTQEGGKIFITMPYIEGVSGEAFATYGDIGVSKVLRSALDELLAVEFRKSEVKLIPVTAFREKIEEIAAKINVARFAQFGEKITRSLQKFDGFIEMPVGPCHGDLTLSNIIVSRHFGVKLIDFLATFSESPLQDVSKIIQDYRYGWSFRYLPTPLKIKGQIFMRNSMPNYVEEARSRFREAIDLFVCLTLYRIAPYLKDEVTEAWLLKSLSESVELI